MKPSNLFGTSHWVLLIALAFARAQAAQVWTGPAITFAQPASDATVAANQDRLTGKVWLSRAKTRGLFNAKSESGYGLGSPADTEWAYGKLADRASLTYENWESWNGHFPPSMVGQEAVLHLISEDIYLSITFSTWGRQSAGKFSYTRSTPAPTTVDTPLLTVPAVAALTLLLAATGCRALGRSAPNRAQIPARWEPSNGAQPQSLI